VQRKGQVCILDIDVQGARNVKRSDLNAYFLFIAPPSMEDLEVRLRGRGTESEEDIQKRLGNAAAELEYGQEAGNFDKVVVNNNLASTAAEISSIVKEWYPTLIEEGSSLDRRLMRHCALCVIS
jgi:guanylate kinase